MLDDVAAGSRRLSPGLDEQLAEVRALYPPHRRTIAGHTWTCLEAGDGDQVVLLLPGALGEADTCFQYVLALRDRYRVVSLNYPPTLDRLWPLLDDLALLLQQMGIARAHIVGGSYSGLVAQYFAAQHPACVAALLLSTTGVPGGASALRRRWAARAVQVAPESWLQWLMQAGVRRFLPAGTAEQAFWRRYFAAALPSWDKRALCTRLRLAAEMETRANAERMRRTPFAGPLLILQAEDDRLVTQHERYTLSTLYPHATQATIDGEGHAASLDKAGACIQIYRSFLCNLPVAAQS